MGLRDRVSQAAEGARERIAEQREEASGRMEVASRAAADKLAADQAALSALIDKNGRWEYRVETLTTIVGRDKLRMGQMTSLLAELGQQGWILCTLNLDADIRGHRDGHLMVFRRRTA